MSTVEYVIRAEFRRERSFILLTSRSRQKITMQVSSLFVSLSVVGTNQELPRWKLEGLGHPNRRRIYGPIHKTGMI